MKLTATPYGTLLILIGLGAFAITGFDSYTALIPCGFGLLALVLTRVGGKVANFGKLFDGSHGKPVAGWAQLAMFVLSVLFVLTMLMPAGKAKGK